MLERKHALTCTRVCFWSFQNLEFSRIIFFTLPFLILFALVTSTELSPQRSIFYTVYRICEKQSRNEDSKKTRLSLRCEDAEMCLESSIFHSQKQGKPGAGGRGWEIYSPRRRGSRYNIIPHNRRKRKSLIFYHIDPGAKWRGLGTKTLKFKEFEQNS